MGTKTLLLKLRFCRNKLPLTVIITLGLLVLSGFWGLGLFTPGFGAVKATRANAPPTAEIATNVTTGTVPLTVMFQGSGTDTDGTIISYFWDFADGTNSSQQNVSHAFHASGNYHVALTVTDNGSTTGTANVWINVSAQPPVLRITEVAFNNGGGGFAEDWTELYCLDDGTGVNGPGLNLSGYYLDDIEGAKDKSFGATVIKSGEYLLLHYFNTTTDELSAMGGNGDDVVDVYTDISSLGLNKVNDQVVLYNSMAQMLDAVAWSGEPYDELNDINELFINGQWSANTTASCINSTLVPAGYSITRDSDATDTNNKDDWYIAYDPSPGQASSYPDTVPPMIAIGAVVDSITVSSANLSWSTNEPTNASVEYGLNATDLILNLSDPEFATEHLVTFTGLEPATMYYYQIVMWDRWGNSNNTSIFHFTTEPDTTAPEIANISAVATGTSLTVYWHTNEPANSTVNYGSTMDLGMVTTDGNFVIEHSALITDLAPDTKYYLQLNCSDGNGNWVQSEVLNFSTLDTVAPFPVTGLTVAAVGDGFVNLTWLASNATDIAGYRIYWKSVDFSNVDGLTPQDEVNASVTMYSATGLTNDTMYYFAVTAIDEVPNENTLVTTVSATPNPPVITGNITGTVTDAAGPLEGVLVAVEGMVSTYFTFTASNGFYDLGNLPGGTYDLVFSKTDYVTKRLTGVAVTAGGVTSGQNVVLERKKAILTGTVTASGPGGAIQGAVVTINGTDLENITDEEGRYTFSAVPVGAHDLSVTAEGFYPAYHTGVNVAAPITTEDFVLLPMPIGPEAGNITGKVRDAQTNAILVDVTIAINGTGLSTKSNATGAYLFTNLTAGKYNLTATFNGYYPRTVEVAVNISETTVQDLKLTKIPPKTGNIVGHIKDVKNTNIVGATVRVEETGEAVSTNATGWYELLYLEVGQYTLEVTADPDVYAPANTTVWVLADQTTMANFTLWMLNHAPQLRNGIVSPTTGDTETLFTFQVTYTDVDGNAPAFIRVVLDSKQIEMGDPSGTITTGMTYKYTTKLDEGTHTFYFIANDGKADAAAGDTSTPTSSSNQDLVSNVQTANHPPILKEAKMEPMSGDTDTTFTFSVVYQDEDGDEPSDINLYVNNKRYPLEKVPGGDVKTGAVFKRSLKLGEGKHIYYFRASDGMAQATPVGATPTSSANAWSTSAISAKPAAFPLFWILVIIIIVIVVIIVALLLYWRSTKAPRPGEEPMMEEAPVEAPGAYPPGAMPYRAAYGEPMPQYEPGMEEIEAVGEFECPNCGEPVGVDEPMCPNCGVEFEEADFQCPRCGATIAAETETCPECGEEFFEPVEEYAEEEETGLAYDEELVFEEDEEPLSGGEPEGWAVEEEEAAAESEEKLGSEDDFEREGREVDEDAKDSMDDVEFEDLTPLEDLDEE